MLLEAQFQAKLRETTLSEQPPYEKQLATSSVSDNYGIHPRNKKRSHIIISSREIQIFYNYTGQQIFSDQLLLR